MIDRAFSAPRSRDLEEPQLHTPASVAQLGSGRAGDLADPFHDAGQHAHSIS